MTVRSALALMLLSWAVGADVSAEDWPQFLGLQRNGVSPETGLINSFSAQGPREVWRVSGGVGMSGIAIVGETVCTLVQDEQHQYVLALDAQTGQTRWRTAAAPAYENAMGPGPRGTPCIHGERVLVYTGDGVLAALDLKSGDIQWSHSPIRDLGGRAAEYGMACSPVVADGNVIVQVGAPQATVAAFDVVTGKLTWKAGRDDTAGYSSPALLRLQGHSQLVAFCGKTVLGCDPKSGKLLWRHPYVTDYDCNIATPLLVDDGIFISAGENHGSALLKISATGEVSEKWSSQGSSSVLRNEWQTSVLLDGYLYGFDNVGSAGPVTNLTCVEAATGQQKWLQRRFGKGNLIAADGKLWISTMAGELVLVEATPESFHELGRAEVMQTTRQAPGLANGRLYVRDSAEIICFDIRR